jgi:DNA polymerase IV
MPPRAILFVDPPAFCTTVEELVAPALRSRPLAVAPQGADRAVVLALSGEARLAGIERGMPVRYARRLCSDLVLLPPNPRLYARASRALHEILRVYAPIIEPRGYGHAFLDLTGTDRLFGRAVDVAARVQREVRERIRLPVSVGVATNKLVSQAVIQAGRRDRTDQESPWQVSAGGEPGFLAPLPVRLWPEVPGGIIERLDDYQLELIGEVAAIPEPALCAVFGGIGRTLRARARGIDPRPVLPPERQAEFYLEHTLATDTNDLGVLHALLRLMSERLGRRLRRRGFTAARLRVEAIYADHTSAARAVSLHAAALDTELWDAARRAFTLANAKRLAVRVVAVTVDRLEEANTQLDLWRDGYGEDGQGGGRGDAPTDGQAGRRADGHLQRPSRAGSTPSRLGSTSPPAGGTSSRAQRGILPGSGASRDDRSVRLQSAIDRIRTRYGTSALATARLPIGPPLRPPT